MTHDLIERYVYAVTRRLPGKQRGDVEKELRSLIEDMLDERCGDIVPTEQDIRVVLAELGTPSELAAKYDPAGERVLIGPKYYRTYTTVLKIALIATALAAVLGGVLDILTSEPEKFWYMIVFEIIGMIVSGCLSTFGVVTFIFAFFEYKGVNLDNHDELANLPSVPSENEIIKRGDCIAGIAISIIFTILFLCCPQIIGFGVVETGEFLPLFSADVMRSLWPFIIGMCIAGVVDEAVKLYEGRYTVLVMITTIVTNIVSLVFAAFIFLGNGIVNFTYVDYIVAQTGSDSEIVSMLFSNIGVVVFGAFCLAMVIDTIVTIVRTANRTRD